MTPLPATSGNLLEQLCECENPTRGWYTYRGDGLRHCDQCDGLCPRCEGDGAYTRLADCTSFDAGCACNGARVSIDPCDLCLCA